MPSSVQQEIRQKRPFDSIGQEGVIALLRTAAVVRRQFELLMQREGITFQQYNVLRILRGAGEPLPTMKVSERMIEPEPGITRLLGRLEKKNLIRREQSATDARQYLCHITPEGKNILERLDEPVARLDEQVLGSLSAGQQLTLIEILDAIRNDLNASP